MLIGSIRPDSLAAAFFGAAADFSAGFAVSAEGASSGSDADFFLPREDALAATSFTVRRKLLAFVDSDFAFLAGVLVSGSVPELVFFLVGAMSSVPLEEKYQICRWLCQFTAQFPNHWLPQVRRFDRSRFKLSEFQPSRSERFRRIRATASPPSLPSQRE
ncbi:MAG: hypothetical protein RLY93_02670 [Sumerlaeia bacterium]